MFCIYKNIKNNCFYVLVCGDCVPPLPPKRKQCAQIPDHDYLPVKTGILEIRTVIEQLFELKNKRKDRIQIETVEIHVKNNSKQYLNYVYQTDVRKCLTDLLDGVIDPGTIINGVYNHFDVWALSIYMDFLRNHGR